MVGEPRGYAYFNFDDEVILAAAIADPVGFVMDLPDHAILDEVQRVPAIFPALRRAVDRRRTPGRVRMTRHSTSIRQKRVARGSPER